jgi:SAM-dependent methyltransferase
MRLGPIPTSSPQREILMTTDRAPHWDNVYGAKRADEVSWFQSRPETSLKLIHRIGPSRDAAIIDVGAGASRLTECLIEEGFTDLSVLDISAAGLAQAKHRLGRDAARVSWITADVTSWRPPRTYTIWHDRAVLHFLTDAASQRAYADVLRAATQADSWIIIGGFAPGGPTKCSGLDIVQHDAESLGALLGEGFTLLETHGEIHVTPADREQAFRYHLFQRRS